MPQFHVAKVSRTRIASFPTPWLYALALPPPVYVARIWLCTAMRRCSGGLAPLTPAAAAAEEQTRGAVAIEWEWLTSSCFGEGDRCAAAGRCLQGRPRLGGGVVREVRGGRAVPLTKVPQLSKIRRRHGKTVRKKRTSMARVPLVYTRAAPRPCTRSVASCYRSRSSFSRPHPQTDAGECTLAIPAARRLQLCMRGACAAVES